MNRKIKFRVWCQGIQSFSRQPLLDCEGSQLTWFHSGNERSFSDIRFDGYIVQQFTGFLDIHGKEIYEGDLVNFYVPAITHGPPREDYQKIEVWFDEDCGDWSFGRFESGYDWSFCWNDIKGAEIVGNIFEDL